MGWKSHWKKSTDLYQQRYRYKSAAKILNEDFEKNNTCTTNLSTAFQLISVYGRKASSDKPLIAYTYNFIFVFRIHNDVW
jgi:hypothetical protein